MPEEETTDWEGVAKSFQIENELLRSFMKGTYVDARRNKRPPMSIPIREVLSWIEYHPMATMIFVYCLYLACMLSINLIDIQHRR